MTKRQTATHCKHGHEWTEENTITRANAGKACRECGRIAARKYQAKLRADREAVAALEDTHCPDGHAYSDEEPQRRINPTSRQWEWYRPCKGCAYVAMRLRQETKTRGEGE